MATFRAVLESQELLPQILAKLPRRVCKSGEGGHPSSLPSHCCLVCCAHVCRQFLESSDHVYRGLLLTSTPSDGHCLAHLSWRRQYHIRTSLPSSMSKFQSMGWFSRQYRFSADIRRGVRGEDPSPNRLVDGGARELQLRRTGGSDGEETGVDHRDERRQTAHHVERPRHPWLRWLHVGGCPEGDHQSRLRRDDPGDAHERRCARSEFGPRRGATEKAINGASDDIRRRWARARWRSSMTR
jgi:hypothetical protein